MQSNLFLKHIILVSILEVTPNHIPLKYIFVIKVSNRIRHVYPTIVNPISLVILYHSYICDEGFTFNWYNKGMDIR